MHSHYPPSAYGPYPRVPWTLEKILERDREFLALATQSYKRGGIPDGPCFNMSCSNPRSRKGPEAPFCKDCRKSARLVFHCLVCGRPARYPKERVKASMKGPAFALVPCDACEPLKPGEDGYADEQASQSPPATPSAPKRDVVRSPRGRRARAA